MSIIKRHANTGLRRLHIGASLLLVLTACTGTAHTPPVARVARHITTIHGLQRVDNYYWLRHRTDQSVIDYLNDENRYTDSMMKRTVGLQKQLFREMKGRIKETDLSVPARDGDYFYYTRSVAGKQYPVHCRKRGAVDGDEEIILDENKLAAGKGYFRIGIFDVSPDHNLLAYSVDTKGTETYTIYFKDLRTGRLTLDEIPDTYYSSAWGNDSKTFFYTVLDDAKRPHKLLRHVLGTAVDRDELVHHETDERFFVRVGTTRSKRFILLNLQSQITTEVRYVDAGRPGDPFRIMHPRQQGMEYSVRHQGDYFYIVTNDNAVNFKVMRTPTSSPSKGNWTSFIPHTPGVKIDGLDAFANHLAVYQRNNGLRTLRIMNLTTGKDHHVTFPEPVYTYRATDNDVYDTNVLRFTYNSLVTPASVFDYDMDARTRVLKKRTEVLGGYDPDLYTSERIFATAADGTRVPISLVYRRGIKRDGTNPTLLDGYGSYGASRDPRFSSNRLSLLDRGFVYAIAHIRGGGDMGRPWYDDGKLLKKRNTFTDFIACAERLIDAGYTSPAHLAITGGSAGGLLMGAVTNLRPDLFQAVVARVPFVDVVNTMLDASIPLTVIEYEEWGNPNDKTYYDYMMTYSPYDNVVAKDYPNLLITAGLNDPRVQYWEPAKWTAKLRALKTNDNLLLLKTNMGAGHGGASGRYDRLRDTSFWYAFVLDRLGV